MPQGGGLSLCSTQPYEDPLVRSIVEKEPESKSGCGELSGLQVLADLLQQAHHDGL